MSIDVKTPLGVGWWLLRLSRELNLPDRQARLELIDLWFSGKPPSDLKMQPGTSRDFTCWSRTNFCELIAEAPRLRLSPLGIRTSSDGDATGDAEAWRIWNRAKLPLVSDEVHRLFLRFGEAYALVSPPAEGSKIPVVTAEDPRYVIGEADVMDPWTTIAGMKVFRDPVAGRDYAYLYRPGRVDVAFRDSTRRLGSPVFSADWSIDEERSRDLPDGLMPLVRFVNRDGVGEFERHLDLLSRINHEVLWRMTIAAVQAFRQRGFKGLPDVDPKTNQRIDYNEIFSADPGALWMIPADVDIWESQQVDLQPILAAVREDLKMLSAVTSTPLQMLDPGGENQSAEGAASAKEALVFKVRDRMKLITPSWSAVMQACFQWVADRSEGQDRVDAEKRADLDGIGVIWAPAEMQSLAERASAAAQAHAAGVPWRTIMIDVMGYSPSQVDLMETEREDDLVFAQRLASMKAGAISPPPAADQAVPDRAAPEPAAA